MIYTQIDMPLTAIDDFEKLGEDNELFKRLYEECKKYDGCWNKDAEKVLLDYYNISLNE